MTNATKMNYDLLFKPFMMLYINLRYENLIYQSEDMLSQSDYSKLSVISEKLVDMLPDGKIANHYKKMYCDGKSVEIQQDYERYIFGKDEAEMFYQFRKSFTNNQILTLDQQIQKHIKVFGDLVDGLYALHLQQKELIKNMGD